MSIDDEPPTEMWALRPQAGFTEVWSENGEFIASFPRHGQAEAVVDMHNFDVEVNRPQSPEVEKSEAEKMTDRLAHYREHDPKGKTIIAMLIAGASRLERLLSLDASRCIVTHQIGTLGTRVQTLKEMFPEDES